MLTQWRWQWLVPISRLLELTVFVCKCRVFLRHFSLSLLSIEYFSVDSSSSFCCKICIIKIRTKCEWSLWEQLNGTKKYSLWFTKKANCCVWVTKNIFIEFYIVEILTVHSPSNEKKCKSIWLFKPRQSVRLINEICFIHHNPSLAHHSSHKKNFPKQNFILAIAK